jgi:hypothetical protein
MVGPGGTTALWCRWHGRLARRLGDACAGGHGGGGGPLDVFGAIIQAMPAGPGALAAWRGAPPAAARR